MKIVVQIGSVLAVFYPSAQSGLVLVALTFYSCLALGNPAGGNPFPAIPVLLLFVLPYLLLLWWLTFCRCYLEEAVSLGGDAIRVFRNGRPLLPGLLGMWFCTSEWDGMLPLRARRCLSVPEGRTCLLKIALWSA
jgi:hypothetical protein